MIVLNTGDILLGGASTANLVDYSIHGISGDTLIQLGNGQLGTSGTIYTAPSVIGVQSVILVNGDTNSQKVNLALLGTSGTRRLTPQDLVLSPGFSLHFEGGKVMVLGVSGNIQDSGTSGTSGSSGIPTTIGGFATIDFGSTPTDEASVVITGLTNMTTTANIFIFIQDDDSTADNTSDDHTALAYFARCTPSARVAGVGFTANVRLLGGFAKGTYKIHYIYVL